MFEVKNVLPDHMPEGGGYVIQRKCGRCVCCIGEFANNRLEDANDATADSG